MDQKNHVQRFNEVSQNYVEDLDKNLRLTGASSNYFYRYKLNLIHKIGSRQPQKILDFGCAVGAFTKMLAQDFPNSQVFGYDPANDCIETAREINSQVPNLTFISGFESSAEKFDLIIVAGVLHHIPESEVFSVIQKIKSLLNNSGEVFIFEHNPLSPITQIIVKNAPVDKGANLLFRGETGKMLREASFQNISSSFISLFPPFLGFLAPLETYFGWFPFSAQYMFHAK